MAAFDLEIGLTGTGWAAASLRFGDISATVTASYLSDAPRDLVEAARLVADGVDEAYCSWAEEPGERRWRLRRIGEELEVEVLAFDRPGVRESGDDGRLLFYARVPAHAFVRSVLRAMDALVERIGADGYAELWARYDYPHDQVEQLRSTLAAMRGREARRQAGRHHP